MIKYTKDINNIVTLVLDRDEGRNNEVNFDIFQAFLPVVAKLEEELANGVLRGVIFLSAKKKFLVGGSPSHLFTKRNKKEAFEISQELKKFYRSIERLKVPVVAAINGDVRGSGYEFVQSCNHRICVDDSGIKIGLNHTRFGVIPGGGAIVRLLWKLGLERSYPIIESGNLYTPKDAVQLGLIEELVELEEDLLPAAVSFIMANPIVIQPWDKPNAKIPYGTLKTLRVARFATDTAASLMKKTFGNYPAKQAVLNTLVEACAVDFDTAQTIESRSFVQTLFSPEAKNMVTAFWNDEHAVKSGLSKPKGFGRFKPRKIGVVGAGTIGSGIAMLAALKGVDVVLKDVSTSIAEQGKANCEAYFKSLCQVGSIDADSCSLAIDKITATEHYRDFEDCDLVIESVFENLILKHKVNKETEKYLDDESVYASNTSTLTVEALSAKSVLKERFVGVRFFSPVETTQIVEIVKGEHTNDESFSKMIDFANFLGKIPIAINDSNGFFTSRLRRSFAEEGARLLAEGNKPAAIEHAALFTGMSIAPLEELDKRLTHYHEKTTDDSVKQVLDALINAFDRKGRTQDKGFYDYDKGVKQSLWDGLAEVYPYKGSIGMEEMQRRLITIQLIEVLRCKQEGIIKTDEEINLASVLGCGFGACHGGVIQYIKTIGVKQLEVDMKELTTKYGSRFDCLELIEWVNK